MSEDPGCICRGNWRAIISEVDCLIDRKFLDNKGDEYVFFGVVHGSDDYYYGMTSTSTGKTRLLSCVGSFEGHGYQLIGQAPEQMSVENQCLMFCAWKGGGPCLAEDCPRRNK